jgi:serine-threonine kinase receptor-associated protein
MDKRKAQVPLVCHGHSRPIVDLSYSPITPDGFFLVSASKGMAFFFFFFFSFLSS